MSSALAGETVPGAGGAADNVLNAFRKAGGAPPGRLVAAHPRSLKTKRIAPQEETGPPGPPGPPEMPQAPPAPVAQTSVAAPGGAPPEQVAPAVTKPVKAPKAPPPGPGEPLPAKKAPAVQAEPLPEVSKDVIKRVGPRPDTDPAQAALWDKVATRLGKGAEFENGIPLVPLRNKQGGFRKDSQKNPLYEQHHYGIVSSPMLGKKAIDYDHEVPGHTKDVTNNEFEFLTQPERLRLSHLINNGAVDTFADKLAQEYSKVKDVPDIMKGKGWYSGVRAVLGKHLGAHADLFANLLAATSPRQGVVQNWKDAYHAYEKFRRGDFDRHIQLYRHGFEMADNGELLKHVLGSGISKGLVDKGIADKLPTTEAGALADWITHHGITPKKDNGKNFGMHSDQVLKVLASTWEREQEGPKTGNFSGNLSGKTLQATIDMWAARTMRRLGYEGFSKKPWVLHPPQERAVHNLDFAFSQLAFRKAAERHGLTPDDLQAIMWYAEQTGWNKKGWSKDDVTKKDYRPLLGQLENMPFEKAAEPHLWEPTKRGP